MSVEDLAKGLEAIDDDDVRAAVAAGDPGVLGDLELTDEEQALLRGAADDYPDVVGFAFELSFKFVEDKQYKLNPAAAKIETGYPAALSYLQANKFQIKYS